MAIYDGIMKGLQEAIEYNEGKITANRTKLTIKPLRDFNAAEIKQIRRILGMTQVSFAGFMGVSHKTVEAWEAGRNMPDGPARRILDMVERDPEIPEKFSIVTSR